MTKLVVTFVLWTLSLLFHACVPLSADPRAAQVAGSFYPADPKELRATVEELLAQYASVEPAASKPRALILPHAGYRYSGPVAARGMREVQGRHYDGVVVVGFTHQQQFAGSSADISDAYETPLGNIPIDLDAVQFLKAQPGISYVEGAHGSGEHSLEVMLPFLQVALGEFRLVPVLMGTARPQDTAALANALVKLAARGDYLFVFSTDLSHYHPYEHAVPQDEQTTAALTQETASAVERLFREETLEACGQGPILVGLLLAERLGYLERRRLVYQNSGDTAGDKTRVVGYAAIAMYERPVTELGEAERRNPEDVVRGTTDSRDRISDSAGHALVRAARQVLQAHFQGAELPPLGLDRYPDLARAQGLFVTLRTQGGSLRGCIGRIQNTDTPLAQLLPTIALDSALHDPRFSPLAAAELDEVDIEVSVLTLPTPVQHPEDIAPGRDGVVLMKDGRTGVLLPQVWQETGWTRVEFLRELAAQKAGLNPEAWRQAQLFTFQDQTFEESP